MIAQSIAKLKMFSAESKIFLWIKPKKNFCGKFGSMPMFRSMRKGEKCCLWWAYVCLTTRCYTTSHLHQVFLFDFAWIFSLFLLVFRTSNFWSLRNLIFKTIIPFMLVGYETGYSQLGATSLVGYLPSQIQLALME